MLEAYSVLTRLPSGLAVPARLASDTLRGRFPESPLRLPAADRADLLHRCAAAGVQGGAAYDALVGLEAAAHDHVLVSLDERAQRTYRLLGVRVEWL